MKGQYCDMCGKLFGAPDMMTRGVVQEYRFSVYFMDHVKPGFIEHQLCVGCFNKFIDFFNKSQAEAEKE